ncbi:MAG: hydroxyacid dehydrogenase [Planctomycetes bacterium]|nr:hydroxyacid dehydrogenase [Planctomycetota bacterium]
MWKGKRLDIFFYEAFEEEAEALKRYLPGDISAGFIFKTIQESGDAEPGGAVISIRTQSVIPTSWSSKISGILTRSTGYDHIKSYLQKCGRFVGSGYLPLYCGRAVAEQAILLSMALLRKLPQQVEQFSSFHRDGLTGRECQGKNLLVVGVGNIGYEVVKVAGALGMNVAGVDIVERHSAVKYVSIEEGIAQADIIICAMNLTSENIAYFNYRLLKKSNPGVIFVNVARGEFSPSADLLKLLDEGRLSAVALDVFNNEPELAVSLRTNAASDDNEIKATLELAKRPNVILTPHNAFNTSESVDKKASQSIEQIKHFLEHGNFKWSVPLES